jgi:aryl-alcohol dehydrogenase-like predicted oxidoreductase
VVTEAIACNATNSWTTSIKHLEENVAAAAIELSEEEFAALSGLSN